MTWQADLQICTYMQPYASDTVLAVGWLEGDHPYPTGEVSEAFMQRFYQVADAARKYTRSAMLGFHTCTLCSPEAMEQPLTTFHSPPYGSCNYWIAAPEALYVVPQLIFHYIKDHRYLPPQPFIDAILTCPLPGSKEYVDLFERHKSKGESTRVTDWRKRDTSSKVGFLGLSHTEP